MATSLGTKAVNDYMAAKKVLIAEPSQSFSSVIHQSLIAMGCQHENVWKETDFSKACHILETQKPEIIISEYSMEGGYGLELAEAQAQLFSSLNQRIFILVSSNADDTAVAEAAEEEVDAYILKPFNIKQLQDAILNVIHRKMNPSPYTAEIQKGKDFLIAKEYELAIKSFKEAKEHDNKPSLACYYEGTAYREIKNLDTALKNFQEGRQHIPLHYKCLQGEFDVLFEQQKQKEAYEVIKLINDNYPVSPNTLSKMFSLAIFTFNYKDIERYYEIFIKLDRRSDELTNVVGAALYSAGRFCLKFEDPSLASDFFKKGVSVAQRNKSYLSKVVQALIKATLFEEAEKFLMMFDVHDRETPDFLVMDFEIVKNTRKSHEVLDKGKKIIEADLGTPDIFREVVNILVQQNKIPYAEEMIFKASKKFPDLRQELYTLIEKNKPQAS